MTDGETTGGEPQTLIVAPDPLDHNANDKIAGYKHRNGITAGRQDALHHGAAHVRDGHQDGIQMQIPVLASRSGFTASGVDSSRRAGLTLIGWAKGRRFVVLSGAERLAFDAPLVAEPPGRGRERRDDD